MGRPTIRATMLSQVATITARLLLFRAGPQDFPYAPQLVPWLPAGGVAAFFLVFRTFLSFGESLLFAVLVIASLGFITHLILSARRTVNRFQQTYHALLATVSVLILATLPAMVMSASTLRQIVAKPELLEQPGAVQVPAVAALLMNVLHLWVLAVVAHIYRHALDTRIWAGALVALMATFSVLFFTVVLAGMLIPMLRLAP